MRFGLLNKVNKILLLFFAKTIFSVCKIFFESSKSFDKGSSSYLVIGTYPTGEWSAIFTALFLLNILEAMEFRPLTVDS